MGHAKNPQLAHVCGGPTENRKVVKCIAEKRSSFQGKLETDFSSFRVENRGG